MVSLEDFITYVSVLQNYKALDLINQALVPSSTIPLEERISALNIPNFWKFLNEDLNIKEVKLALPININNEVKYQIFNLRSLNYLKGIDIFNLIDQFYSSNNNYKNLENLMSSKEYQSRLIISKFEIIGDILILEIENIILSQLSGIPKEIIYEIARKTDLLTLLNLCKTDPAFKGICEDPYVIKEVVKNYTYKDVEKIIDKYDDDKDEKIKSTDFEIIKMIFLYASKTEKDYDYYNSLIGDASSNGYLNLVKLLLQDSRVNPAARDNAAIRWSSSKGYVEVVSLLLQDPRVNPAAKNNNAIRFASLFGRLEVVRLLLQDSRVNPEHLTYEQFKKNFNF